MTRLLLGSASRGRLGVLRQAGVEPLVVVSGVDEDAIIATLGDAPPTAIVGALAAAKADDIVGRLPDGVDADCVVIGCDSMLYLDGQLCGKPGTVDGARRQWRAMSGRTGELHTGHALIAVRNRSVVYRAVESAVTTVHFASPSDADREAYLDSGEPLGVAGGFTLDGLGGWFIDRIDGDPSNVIGLSLPLVRRMLTSAGVSISEVWASNRSD